MCVTATDHVNIRRDFNMGRELSSVSLRSTKSSFVGTSPRIDLTQSAESKRMLGSTCNLVNFDFAICKKRNSDRPFPLVFIFFLGVVLIKFSRSPCKKFRRRLIFSLEQIHFSLVLFWLNFEQKKINNCELALSPKKTNFPGVKH
jgi:hypothetical protein